MSDESNLDVVRQRPGAGLSVIGFKPVDGPGSLRGFVDVHVPAWRLRVFGCPVHESHGRHWVALPGKLQIDRTGLVVRDEDTGKPRYFPVLQFDVVETLRRFSGAAIAALDIYAPGWDR